jgi:ABC-type dipeptide/oligopeptide/nickel transport system permease component
MRTLGRRLVGAVPVLFGISFLVFLLMHLAPGDPVELLLGDNATPAEVARVRHDWGLDQPLLVQYWQFISRAMASIRRSSAIRCWITRARASR